MLRLTINHSVNHPHMHDESISQAFYQTVARYSGQEAIVFEDQRLSWSRVADQVQRLASVLLAQGVQRGDRVGIHCSTRPEYVVAFLASTAVGAMLVGFNINYTVREIREQAAKAQPKVMILYARHPLHEAVAQAVEAMPFVQTRVVLGGSPRRGWLAWDDLLRREPDLQALERRRQQVQPDDGALMVFSGGISGEMNGAVLSHRNILANIREQNRQLEWTAADRIILHLPMNHVSGATLLTIGAVLSGATLLMLERFHPERTLALVQRERATILGQVPAMWAMVYALPNVHDFDLSSVRLTIVSGAPTPGPLLRRIATLAPRTLHAYGLTEVAGMVTYTQAEDDIDILLRSAGRIAPPFELRIIDDDGHPLPPGTVGEVQIRGACVMQGYFRNPAATQAMIDADGWLHTGDLGRLDERGYLSLAGRKKRMFISGGYNVFPVEIERYVQQHPGVAGCRCTYREDGIMGEVGVLEVRPRPGVSLDAAELRRYCKQGLARYKVPRDFIIAV